MGCRDGGEWEGKEWDSELEGWVRSFAGRKVVLESRSVDVNAQSRLEISSL